MVIDIREFEQNNRIGEVVCMLNTSHRLCHNVVESLVKEPMEGNMQDDAADHNHAELHRKLRWYSQCKHPSWQSRSRLHLNWLVVKVCLLHVRVSAHNSEETKLDKRRDRTEGGISGSVRSSAAKDKGCPCVHLPEISVTTGQYDAFSRLPVQGIYSTLQCHMYMLCNTVTLGCSCTVCDIRG
jgi:hypothetical protein